VRRTTLRWMRLRRIRLALTVNRRWKDVSVSLAARQVGHEPQGPHRRGRKQSPRVGHQDGGPEMLTRLAGRPKVWARARAVQLRAADSQLDPVLGRAPHLGCHRAGHGGDQADASLGMVRLSACTDGVSEISRDFLGNPHRHFPCGLAKPAPRALRPGRMRQAARPRRCSETEPHPGCARKRLRGVPVLGVDLWSTRDPCFCLPVKHRPPAPYPAHPSSKSFPALGGRSDQNSERHESSAICVPIKAPLALLRHPEARAGNNPHLKRQDS
jgi:hypothetical protein